MEVDILLVYLVVGIILIFMVLGILIWAIVSIASNNKGKRREDGAGRPPTASGDEANAPQRAAAASTPVPVTKSVVTDPELMRIYRNISTGAIYVEIDGKRYDHLADVYDPQTSRLLLQTVADLNRFTRGVTPAAPLRPAAPSGEAGPSVSPDSAPSPGSLAKRGEALMKEPQPPKVEPGPIPPAGSGLLERGFKLSTVPPAAPKASAQPTAVDDSASAFDKVKQKAELGSFWSRALTPPASSGGKIGPRPLADELEDILQDIMDDLPAKPGCVVHFRTAADGRLIIEVNGAAHHDVNDVQDATARQIVQAVVRKWEAK